MNNVPHIPYYLNTFTFLDIVPTLTEPIKTKNSMHGHAAKQIVMKTNSLRNFSASVRLTAVRPTYLYFCLNNSECNLRRHIMLISVNTSLDSLILRHFL